MNKHGTQHSLEEDLIKSLSASFERPLIRFFMRRGLDASEAKDCTQEVFARVIDKTSLSDLENPQGYIFRIANNLWIDQARKVSTKNNDKFISESEISLYCEKPQQERIVAGQEELAIIKQAILTMPEKTQRIFLLNRFEQLKYKEIAELLGQSVSSIEKHMMKALVHLNKVRNLL